MRSDQIRSLLHGSEHGRHDTRHIHDLGRALARERLHLTAKASKPGQPSDLLWDRSGTSYKVVTRTLQIEGTATTFEVGHQVQADYLCGVLLQRPGFQLTEMVRLPWPTVLWLATITQDRLRLRWSPTSAAFEVAERL